MTMISYYDHYHRHHPCHYYYYCHFHSHCHCQCQCQCHRHIIIIIIISITIKIKFLFLFISVFIHTQFTFSHQIVSFRHIQPSRATPSSWRYSHVTSHNVTLNTGAHHRKKHNVIDISYLFLVRGVCYGSPQRQHQAAVDTCRIS